jgi:tetratricopeptide (TPR) repeat protein
MDCRVKPAMTQRQKAVVDNDGLSCCERLVAKDTENSRWQSDLSVSHEHVGRIRLAQGDLAATLAEFGVALKARELLAKKDPNNAGWQRDLASIHVAIGAALIGSGEVERGAAEYRAALAILETLAAKAPDNAAVEKDLDSVRQKVAALPRAATEPVGEPKP